MKHPLDKDVAIAILFVLADLHPKEPIELDVIGFDTLYIIRARGFKGRLTLDEMLRVRAVNDSFTHTPIKRIYIDWEGAWLTCEFDKFEMCGQVTTQRVIVGPAAAPHRERRNVRIDDDGDGDDDGDQRTYGKGGYRPVPKRERSLSPPRRQEHFATAPGFRTDGRGNRIYDDDDDDRMDARAGRNAGARVRGGGGGVRTFLTSLWPGGGGTSSRNNNNNNNNDDF